MKLLEVIVTSLQEAQEAEQGGADRLELVRDLQHDGLTPPRDLVERVLSSVTIPVRVMLRTAPSFILQDGKELDCLLEGARYLSGLPVDGIVAGYLRDDSVDVCAMRHVMAAARDKRITFHRALEHVADPVDAIATLKQFPTIDRVLINGGDGSWTARRARLERLQDEAGPEITIMTGGGLTREGLNILAESRQLNEFHTGSAVRDESGTVRSHLVSKLRRDLDSHQ